MFAELLPQSIPQLLADAQAAQRQGDHVQARRLLLQAIQLDPTTRAAWEALVTLETGAQRAMCLRWLAHLTPAEAAHQQQGVAWRSRGSRWLIMPAAASLLAVLWGAGALPYQQRIVPGVAVASVAVGGLTLREAHAKIQPSLAMPVNQLITLRSGDLQWEVPLPELVEMNPDALKAAYGIGHQGNWITQTAERWAHLLGSTADVPVIKPNLKQIDRWVHDLSLTLDRAALDAQIVRTASGFGLAPARMGQVVDRASLRAQLFMAAEQQTVQRRSITVPILPVAPQITQAQLVPLRDQLNALAQQPLWITIDGQRWPVDRTALVLRNLTEGQLQISPGAIKQLVTRLAVTLDRPAQASQLVRQGERVRAITPGIAGRRLAQTAAQAQLAAAVFAPVQELVLPTLTETPPPGEAEQLGLLAELGRGTSQFLTYSSPERDANVQVGGQDIDGVLIPPGGEFSFTRTVGQITWEKGYRWGEMIEGGQSVPALGGGICQVSTTVFRAAFWSGLPITERHNHSWRLAWYEVDSPPGLDATIALGGPDLRFRNDTPGHVLIKVETDLVNKRQTVVIYGTPTARTVELNLQAEPHIAVQRVIRQGAQVSQELFVSNYGY